MKSLLVSRLSPLLILAALLTLAACDTGAKHAISVITDQTTTLGEPLTVPVTITGATSATVTATSSDQTIVPDVNIDVTGSGTDYTLTITPSATTSGTATITVSAAANGKSVTRAFDVAVEQPFVGSEAELKGLNNEVIGEAVAVSEDYLVAGGIEYAYVFWRVDDEWKPMAKLTASDAGPGQFFGNSVAVSGDVIVVGSDRHGGGAAYVFERVGNSWTEVDKLVDPLPELQDSFGRSVAIDRDTIVVGAQGDENQGVDSGSVFVFTKQDLGGWSLWGKLGPVDPVDSDTLGEEVDIDGTYLIAGNYGHDTPTVDAAGSATIYRLDGGVWTIDDTLSPGELEAGDHFGISVAISGEYALVGSVNDDDAGLNAGAVYVYHRGDSGWTEVDKLTADNAAEHEAFGYNVALDYPYAVVGAYNDDEPVSRAGSAYVYRHDGTTWHLVAELDAPEPKVEERFGWDVDVAGEHLVVMGGEGPIVVAFRR